MREPLLEPKHGGNLAACHFPLTDVSSTSRASAPIAQLDRASPS